MISVATSFMMIRPWSIGIPCILRSWTTNAEAGGDTGMLCLYIVSFMREGTSSMNIALSVRG